jgi:hypothetical protein
MMLLDIYTRVLQDAEYQARLAEKQQATESAGVTPEETAVEPALQSDPRTRDEQAAAKRQREARMNGTELRSNTAPHTGWAARLARNQGAAAVLAFAALMPGAVTHELNQMSRGSMGVEHARISVMHTGRISMTHVGRLGVLHVGRLGAVRIGRPVPIDPPSPIW